MPLDPTPRLRIEVDVTGVPPYADDAWSWPDEADQDPDVQDFLDSYTTGDEA